MDPKQNGGQVIFFKERWKYLLQSLHRDLKRLSY